MVDGELGRIEEEQAALRRVAMLVVHGAPPTEVFSAVAGEMGRIMGADFYTTIGRYRPDNTLTIVTTWGRTPGLVMPTVGSTWSLESDSVAARVVRTGKPARMCYDDVTEGIALWAKRHSARSGVGCPIMVEGRLWGLMAMISRKALPEEESLEERMLGFIELVSAAIANAESRDELAASRARVVAAADATCRRIERDLHDGVQQRLIACGLQIREAQENLPPGSKNLEQQLALAAECLNEVFSEVREISHGLHPAILSRGGIGQALKALARRSAIPVELDVQSFLRFPGAVDVALYYVVSEALTNAAKHAHASAVRVHLSVKDSVACVSVRDDGIGGADYDRGSGLIGLKDRIEALGGRLEIVSPTGAGTAMYAEVPIGGLDSPDGITG
jgi:signal transduction histidine kinase